MREKLIELLYNFHMETNNHICDGCGSVYAEKVCEEIADHLIANGVTIPVRCKDCKYWCYEYDDVGLCVTDVPDIDGVQRLADDFCSYGEKREV